MSKTKNPRIGSWADANRFTPNDWKEITSLARNCLENDVFGGHQGKCWVAAFIIWLGTLPEERKAIHPEDTSIN
jgi:hypothetical protein